MWPHLELNFWLWHSDPCFSSVISSHATTSILFCCLWLTWYSFYSVVFPLCLPSSCLDNYFGKIECLPVEVALLKDPSLSVRLCRARPGTLVVTSFSAKFYFHFWKRFFFVFVIMFAAVIQPHCLVESRRRRTEEVKTDLQLMIDGKLQEMQVSLITWQRVESCRIKMQVFFCAGIRIKRWFVQNSLRGQGLFCQII